MTERLKERISTRAEYFGDFFIMSDNGVIEDERSQIKDEGGDDEVRDGMFRYIHYHDLCTVLLGRLAALQDCKRMGADKKLCRKKYQR